MIRDDGDRLCPVCRDRAWLATRFATLVAPPRPKPRSRSSSPPITDTDDYGTTVRGPRRYERHTGPRTRTPGFRSFFFQRSRPRHVSVDQRPPPLSGFSATAIEESMVGSTDRALAKLSGSEFPGRCRSRRVVSPPTVVVQPIFSLRVPTTNRSASYPPRRDRDRGGHACPSAALAVGRCRTRPSPLERVDLQRRSSRASVCAKLSVVYRSRPYPPAVRYGTPPRAR
jgi:hypothetical protein